MLPMAAAAPPSAITVWALPNRDLEMMAVRLPASRASIAARRPAPPAPITTTSKRCRSMFSVIVRPSVDEPQVGEPAGGDGEDVYVDQREGAERDPGQFLVTSVQSGHERPRAVPDGVPGEVLEPPTDDVPARVAGHRIGPQQHDVEQHDQVAEAE